MSDQPQISFTHPGDSPAYVTVTKRHSGHFTITVRSVAHATGDTGHIGAITMEPKDFADLLAKCNALAPQS